MLPHDIVGSMTVQIKYYKICFRPPSFPWHSGSHSAMCFDRTGNFLSVVYVLSDFGIYSVMFVALIGKGISTKNSRPLPRNVLSVPGQ